MSIRPHPAIVVAAVTAAIGAGLGGDPVPVSGVEPHRGLPLPAEPPSILLSEVTASVIAHDLDGDGVREVVGVVAREDDSELAAVQAWAVAADGSVDASNKAPVRRSASVEELAASRVRREIDSDGMLPVRLSEPARLFAARRAGEDVVLIAALGTENTLGGSCCLTIWEVSPTSGVDISLRLVAETHRYAGQLVPADIDGDGTDELLVLEGPPEEATSADAALLRWAGTEFTRLGFAIPGVMSWSTFTLDVGESDGYAGDEVIALGSREPLERDGVFQDFPILMRMSLRDGSPNVERLDIQGYIDAAQATALGDSPALLIGQGSVLHLWSWPRDQAPVELASHYSAGSLAAVFQSVESACTAVTASYFGFFPGDTTRQMEAFPCDLGRARERTVTVADSTRPSDFTSGFAFQDIPSPQPFVGTVPGGFPGMPHAFISGGQMVVLPADSDEVAEVMDVALLPGLGIIGTAGEGGRWVALIAGADRAFDSSFPMTPRVDLWPQTPGALRLIEVQSILEPEVSDARLEPTFYGAAPPPDPDGPSDFLIGIGAVDLEIRGPAGSRIWWTSHDGQGEEVIGANGVARIHVLDPAEPGAKEGSRRYVRAWIVTPAGHGYAGRWRMVVDRSPPDLAILEDTPLLDFEPILTGLTLPGTTLTVNGDPATVQGDGTFAVPVHVGIIPTELWVVATDPVGNQTQRLATRVWPLDYRQLPFVPIVFLVTVAAAAVLFLRGPEAGPGHRSPDDDATFEEIGG